MNKYKGHNGARRKLKRYVKHIDCIRENTFSHSKQYDILSDIHGKMFHVISSLPDDDSAWIDLGIIRDELVQLDFECYRDDALRGTY